MLRALFARLRARFERRDAAAEDEETAFLPSQLDASVLFAHGLGTSKAEREMADVEEEAQALEAERREG